MLAQRAEDLAHAPVHLHHHVAKQTGLAFAFEFFGNKKRHMHHRMRHVEEERSLLVFLNERHRAFGVLRGELFLIFAGDAGVDDRVAVDERQMRPAFEPLFHWQMHYAGVVRPHVIRVWQSKVIIEAMLQRQKFLVMAEMPFAVTCRGVVFLFAEFRDRHLICIDTMLCLGTERAENAHAHIVTAGEQPCT